jgi:hypothetical protein
MAGVVGAFLSNDLPAERIERPSDGVTVRQDVVGIIELAVLVLKFGSYRSACSALTRQAQNFGGRFRIGSYGPQAGR